MSSTNGNIENEEYWKIVHIPDKPPISPHLQPTGKHLLSKIIYSGRDYWSNTD